LTPKAPLLPPKQETFVCEAAVKEIGDGSVMVKFINAVQPFASVAVTVHVPAVNPLTEVVPSPVGLPGVQS
jgi:hypothetical protein